MAARRARDEARSASSSIGTAFPRRLCREAMELTSPLDAETWASMILGMFWTKRYELPIEDFDDPAWAYGAALMDAVARQGGPGARIALTAIARVDDGELGLRAGELAARTIVPAGSLPDWLDDVGDTEVLAAAVMRDDVFDDGFTVWVEARHRGRPPHALGVYIDNNLGVMAKDTLLADSIDSVERIMEQNPDPTVVGLRLEPIDVRLAAAHIHAAIELTDMTFRAPVDDEYAPLRALALCRADGTPGPLVDPPAKPEIAQEERDRLRDEFLAAPEGRAFAPDGDEAYAASLAIDFCADHVDGRPLRWSPVVVELFMASWIPRKVLVDRETLERVPDGLDAWVRFAGRKSGMPSWAIEQTREAITEWSGEMLERSFDEEAGGPTKQFMMAATNAGVDFTDQKALDTFVAGWNARSQL